MSAEYSDDKSFDSFDATERQRIWDEAFAHSRRRALIEQAKGMLMFVYGIDQDAAFDVMRIQSQRHNVKLALIAEQIVKDMVQLRLAKGLGRRLAFDGLMLTAHQRITDSAARQPNGASKTGVPMKDL